MAPQNVSLCHKDAFELKTAENQQIQEEFSVLTLIHLEVGASVFLEKVSPSPGPRVNSYHQRQD